MGRGGWRCWAEPRIETAVAVIGALVAGVPVIPVNPKSGTSELEHIVSDAEPDAIAVAPGSEVPRPSRAAAASRSTSTATSRAMAATSGPQRREPCPHRLYVGDHGPPQGRGPAAPLDRLRTSTRSPRCGDGPTPTSSPMGCRCSTSTAWSSGSSVRCGAAARPCTSGASTRGRSEGAERARNDALRSAHDVSPSRRRGRRVAGAGDGPGPRPSARVGLGRPAGLRARAASRS